MLLWKAALALLSWPIAVWRSLQARRRLGGYARPAQLRRFTLERVA